jgi:GAF domain-containing protein
MKALDELGRLVLGETDPRQLARIASTVIKHCLMLPYVALVRVDHERNLLEYLGHAADVEPNLQPGQTQPLAKGLVGLCAREGHTVFVSDVHSDPNYVEIISGVTCELAAPVIAGDTVVAVLNCEARDVATLREARTFIEIAANRLGAAFENARLLRERAAAVDREKEHARG